MKWRTTVIRRRNLTPRIKGSQQVSSPIGVETASRITGRGGTDFRPGFAWLEEHGIRPGVCLYLTDMLCSSYPETEPESPTIWCNYGQPPSDWNREPWGERIDIGPDVDTRHSAYYGPP